MRLIATALALLAGGWLLDRGRVRVARVARVSRVVADLDRAEAFYRDGLGFRRVAAGPMDPGLAGLLVPGGAASVRRMRLGAEELDLVRWERPGTAYPRGSRSDDEWFQHLAVVADDPEAAYARVLRAGPMPISAHGPVTLPGERGRPGVVAFKFRDPDGHPVEIIHFPLGTGRAVWRWAVPRDGAGPFLGVDHSAIVAGSTQRSLRFWRGLGFRRVSETWNTGPAQQSLDGLAGATARVSGLRPGGEAVGAAGMGVELLAYQPPGRAAPRAPADSLVTDWLTLVTGRWRTRAVRDPDGHLLVLAGARRPAPPRPPKVSGARRRRARRRGWRRAGAAPPRRAAGCGGRA